MLGSFPISGKILVITGGGSGIGFALARLAHSSGAKVIIADLKLLAQSQDFVQENANVRFIRCDVRVWNDFEALVSFSEQEFGDVPDVFVANAGVCSPEWSNFWNDEETERYAELEINLSHPIKLTRVAIRALQRKRKRGVVVATASIAGLHGNFGTALYVASKHGVIGFVKSMALAERELGVKVVAICPALTRTPLIANLQDKLDASSSAFDMLEPGEIAQRMLDLIEQDRYPGGTVLGVYKPGDATIVADGNSLLEELGPSDLGYIHAIVEADRAKGSSPA